MEANRNWWGRTIVHLKSTEGYQIFFVRAMQRRSSKGMYLVSSVFFAVTLVSLLDYINPIVSLDEMDVSTGTVVRVIQAARTSCGGKLLLHVNGEHTKKFHLCLSEEDENAVVGREIKVWSQREISMLGKIDYIYQIQVGDVLIKDYKEILPNRKRLNESDPWIIGASSFLTLLPLLHIWRSNRNA